MVRSAPVVANPTFNPVSLLVSPQPIQACDQPENGEGARRHSAAIGARPRWRGDRITILFPQREMSLLARSRRNGMSALRSAFDVLCHQPEIRAVAISKTASGIQIRNAPIRMSERMATNAANISRRTAREENGPSRVTWIRYVRRWWNDLHFPLRASMCSGGIISGSLRGRSLDG